MQPETSPNRRLARVKELLRQELSEIIRREFNIEEVGLLTVNDVGVSRDLRSAIVFLGFVGTIGWAMNLARTAGNNHMMGILGGLTGGPVGSALGWMLDLGASRLPASTQTAAAPAAAAATPAAAPQLKVRVTA